MRGGSLRLQLPLQHAAVTYKNIKITNLYLISVKYAKITG